MCEHKGVFPLEQVEFFGLIIVLVILVLANVAGLGGGGIIIPILMAMFGFSTKEAIALGSVLILSSSLVRFILQVEERHPLKEATVVDYNIVIVMLPMVMLGSFMGVIVNIALPNIILSGLLTTIVTVIAYRGFQTAKRVRNKE
jgi:uncharacterized membrane protein YfcA